jgi:MEMO1 family protein
MGDEALFDRDRPVREPAVAGTFYPAETEDLAQFVDGLLARVDRKLEPDRDLKALVTPHAGYRYSGAVAAEAFVCLRDRPVSTVVLVGPDHYVGFEGVAVYPAGAFRTPLGDVWVDEELADIFLEAGPGVRAAPEAHQREHALEVQLPFLQRVLPEAKIVPVLMGFRSRMNVEALANALSRALDNPRVVIVASTDLSHYHPRDVARKLDQRVTDLVRAFAPTSLWEELRAGKVEACGGDSLVAVMLGAGIAGAETSRILRYGDSADCGGDQRSVVGYLSAALFRGMPPTGVEFAAHEQALSPEEIETLLHLATASARTGVRDPYPVMELRHLTPRLRAPGRAFVTLRRGRELRGCVGYVEPVGALWDTVARAARAAAHEDTRFPPVRPDEVTELTVEVSILTPPRPVALPEEIVAGRHGVIVSARGRRALLLPQAAVEHGWDRETFLAHACLKAGLPPDAWNREGTALSVFEAQIFQAEPGPTPLNGEA